MPIFVAKIETDATVKPQKHTIHFVCKACATVDLIDAVTGYCRACWRTCVLVVAAMREAAK